MAEYGQAGQKLLDRGQINSKNTKMALKGRLTVVGGDRYDILDCMYRVNSATFAFLPSLPPPKPLIVSIECISITVI